MQPGRIQQDAHVGCTGPVPGIHHALSHTTTTNKLELLGLNLPNKQLGTLGRSTSISIRCWCEDCPGASRSILYHSSLDNSIEHMICQRYTKCPKPSSTLFSKRFLAPLPGSRRPQHLRARQDLQACRQLDKASQTHTRPRKHPATIHCEKHPLPRQDLLLLLKFSVKT